MTGIYYFCIKILVMKKLLIFITFFLIVINFTYSSDSLTSKIIVFRANNLSGSSTSLKIYLNDSLIVRIKNNSYFEYKTAPGQYLITVDKSKETEVSLKVDANKTYYLYLSMNSGMFSSKSEMMLVDSAMATNKIRRENIKKQEEITVANIHSKNRIGLNLGYGYGLNNILMARTTDSADVNLSFGGGFLFGIKYGYELTKKLDIAVDFNYQFSFLIPTLNNAAVNFNRSYVALTPSYIFPIGKNDNMRLKAGLGIDYLWYSKLIVNTSNLTTGFNDSWYYSKTLGYHATLLFEKNLNEKWSFSAALKYYYVKYQGTYENPNEKDKLYNSNGSGIDLILGLNYHF